jgi:plasmid stability protein
MAVTPCGMLLRRLVGLTIRNLDDDLKARLRLRVERHGRSMEEEACSILRAVLANCVEDSTGALLYDTIRARVESFGGVDLALPRVSPNAIHRASANIRAAGCRSLSLAPA